jgi:hypothetical protein
MKELNLQFYCLHKHGEVPSLYLSGAIGMKVETKEWEGRK